MSPNKNQQKRLFLGHFKIMHMKLRAVAIWLLAMSTTFIVQAQQQEPDSERKPGHYNTNRFKQLYEEFSTPNQYRSASGAPGPAYYQQQADYKMDLTLNDALSQIYGEETITYTNNSPDQLEYLWVQLDQNKRAPGQGTLDIN